MLQTRSILRWTVVGYLSVAGCATPFWSADPAGEVHVAPIVTESAHATSRGTEGFAEWPPPPLTQNSPRAAWEVAPTQQLPANPAPPHQFTGAPFPQADPRHLLSEMDALRQHDPGRYEEVQRTLRATEGTLPPSYQQMLQEQMLAVAMQQRQDLQSLEPARASHAISDSPPLPLINSSPRGAVAPELASPTAPSATVDVSLSANSTPPSPAPAPSASTPVVPASATAAPTELAPDDASTPSSPAKTDEQSAVPADWHSGVEQAIALLDAELRNDSLDHDERARLQALRRLLSVAANRRDDAVAPIAELDEDEQAFWKHQMFGLLVSLDADGKHAASRRAALALRDLRLAANHLSNISTLDVKNLAFCKQVDSFGEYTEFETASFRAGEEVILYIEVDNFSAQEVGERFETELHGSYQITNETGERITSVVLPVDKQISNNRRRDYFIPYLLTLPKPLAAGSYRLQLTMEDIIGKKSNQASIDFRIR